jgi:hypothetical protein
MLERYLRMTSRDGARLTVRCAAVSSWSVAWAGVSKNSRSDRALLVELRAKLWRPLELRAKPWRPP